MAAEATKVKFQNEQKIFWMISPHYVSFYLGNSRAKKYPLKYLG